MHTLVRVESQKREAAPEPARSHQSPGRTAGKTAAARRTGRQRNGRRRNGGPVEKNRFLTSCVLLAVIAVLLLVILLFLLPVRPEKAVSAVRRPPESRQTEAAADEPQAAPSDTSGSGTLPAAGTPQEQERKSPTGPGREPERTAVPGPDAAVRGKLEIVIDDVGYNTRQLEPFLKFPAPITFAVLPGLRYTGEAARLITGAGKSVILHLPMEAVGGADPGPGALYRNMSDERILEVLGKDFDQIPGLQGVNNHQGSAITADERIMRLVFTEMKKRGLFFLDSLTTSHSVGRKLAGEYQLEYLERTVFLDNEQTKQAIRAAVEEGLKLAERNGHAVMIGHVWSAELAEVLIEMYPFIVDEGFEFSNLPGLLKDDPGYGPRP